MKSQIATSSWGGRLKFEQFETRLSDHDDKIMLIFEYLKQLEKSKQEELEYRNRQQIGYKSKKGK
ncbi:MAG: hypothetical protein ACOCYO_09770 [Bacteroidota bacterium]